MNMTARKFWALLAVCSCDAGGAGGAPGGPNAPSETRHITLQGSIQKGPLVVGSTVLVENLDAALNPTGSVFTTATRNDRGEFDLEFDASRLVSIQGSGFYYNEVTGGLSTGNVTLRAVYGVDDGVEHSVSVNIVTHLTFGRIRKLISDGGTFADARQTAELELQGAIGIVPSSFTVGIDGVHMNVLRGDSDGNAYLLAVSAVLAQAAQAIDAGAADAALQELLNRLALDLEETGTFDAARRATIAAAFATLDTGNVKSRLAERLEALGSGAEVPDLDRILDQDGDGVMNASDNCDRSPNITQDDDDANGIGDACEDNPKALDLLFVVDNSLGMKDKHEVFSVALSELVSRLANPTCVDSSGVEYSAPPPGGLCPKGQRPEFTPVEDIHVGIVSSSLGDAGANVACPAQGYSRYVPDRIDLAHLMGNLDRGRGLPTEPAGFMAWRSGGDLDAFKRGLEQMVLSVGENGCQWEATLESWYRFLVDPFPYRELRRVPCPNSASTAPNCVQPATELDNRIVVDETLLAQRTAFLRPRSRLGIFVVSDENDCSIQVGNQTWVVAAIDDSRPMFRGSSMCAANPNDKCCYSCPLGPPDGCVADSSCNANAAEGALENRLPANQDGQDLRCFQQKRRFGMDFLYPVERYVNALRNRDICWSSPTLSTDECLPENMIPNPLWADGRSPSRVFFGGLIGVPWQAIATHTDAGGRALPEEVLRFQNSTELERNGTWDQILGTPGVPWHAAAVGHPEVPGTMAVPPLVPQMLESEFARSGIQLGNDINGREYSTLEVVMGQADTPNDLEYACIFPLHAPRDCTQQDPATDACDCFQGHVDRPLCEQLPGSSAPGTTQYWAKAYPGTRQLEVLKAYGANAILGSICPREVTNANSAAFGYRPMVSAIVERLKEQLP